MGDSPQSCPNTSECSSRGTLCLVNFTGNLRVLLAEPVPVPVETHTLWRGYRYLGGLPFSDPGYTCTHTRGGYVLINVIQNYTITK